MVCGPYKWYIVLLEKFPKVVIFLLLVVDSTTGEGGREGKVEEIFPNLPPRFDSASDQEGGGGVSIHPHRWYPDSCSSYSVF